MPRVIEVIISPKGQVTIQTKGYTGGECRRASKFLEESLGVVTADRNTAEYHEAAQVQQQQETSA